MIKMKPLLKESTWTNRKFGESLPTLEDYMGESYDDENCGDGHAVVSEADDDDKYVSVGWGKYKEKGKKDDENAPSFTKTDSGKFVKAGGDEKGGDAPEKEPAGKLGGGDFERDFDDDEDGFPASKEDPNGDDSGYEPFTDDPDDIDDLPDTTGGDPDDSWDDEEGRAKPSGGDFTKSADYDMWSDDEPKEKRPGGEQAEDDYQKADQMIKKYAGVDIEKAEFWAKKKKQASDAMVGEITINGKKYKPITESIRPTIYDPHKEIKRVWKNISSRQFDRKWKKEII